MADLALLTGEALGAALDFGAARGFGAAFVGTKSSDASDSSPASFFFFLRAAFIAAFPLGFPDLSAWASSSRTS